MLKQIYQSLLQIPIIIDVKNSFLRFLNHDGAALASFIAFSVLCALFPFLIVIMAITALIGGDGLRTELISNISLVLPENILQYLEPEINKVINQQSGSIFTFGFGALLVTITGAVEGIRSSLNRAYGWDDHRGFLYRRFGALLYAMTGGALFILVVAILVAAPTVWGLLESYIPQMQHFRLVYEITRPASALFLLLALLYSCHMILPAKLLRIRFVTPGIAFTIVAWLLIGQLFSWYLVRFSPYAKVYAGLAGVMATV